MASFDEIDEFERAASAFPDLDDDLGGFGSISGAPAAPAPIASIPNEPLDFSFDPLPSNTGPPVRITGDDEIEKFENQFPDIGEPTYSPPQVQKPASFASFNATPSVLQQPSFASQTVTPALEEEPEVIKQWRAQQAEEINKRDEKSKRRKEEILKQAHQSIDEFYLQHKDSVERSIKENKLKEEEFLTEQSESLSAGTTWSRICDLIELENSQSKTIARTGPGTTDLGRYKEVLLRLKREGPSAPGAGGY